MLSYSDDETTTPGKPTIIAIEKEEMTDTRGTSFNILQNYEIRASEAILDSPDIEDYEKFTYEQGGYVFFILRSNFYMDSFELKTEYESLVLNRHFFKKKCLFKEMSVEYESLVLNRHFFFPIIIQDRLIKLTNLDFRIGGTCLLTYDPINIHLENIDLEYSKNLAGFIVDTS